MHSRHLTLAGFFILITILILPPCAAAGQPTADFVAYPMTTGVAPFTAQFNDQSTLAASWLWNFGDGQTSTASTPVHTFTNPGTYTISLTVTDVSGTLTNTKTIPNYIVVMSEGAPIPTVTATTVPGTTTPIPLTPTYSPSITTIPSTTTTPALAGTIEITSVPAGAMMYLDGAEQGITPITVYKVPIGKHTVKVHTKGYVDNETSVLVEEQKTVHLVISLDTNGAKPVSTLTSTPTLTESLTQETQKAMAYQTTLTIPNQGNGSVLFQCTNCGSNQGEGVLLGDRYAPYSKGMVFRNVPPGTHMMKFVDPAIHCEQETYTVDIRPGEQSTVNARACTPGFTSLLAILSIAGIIGIRKFR